MTNPNITTLTAARTVLVLGATGKTGTRVLARLQQLTDRDLDLRLGSRTAPIPFSWDDPGQWPAVLAGVDAVYLNYYPDLAIPRAADDVARFCSAAMDAGVRRIVLLSGRGEAGAEVCERIVAESGLEWTVLSCAWFMQNFSEGNLLEPILTGELAFPVDEIPEPFVDVEDIAEIAAAALVDDDHLGQRYQITGPESITFADAMARIGAASGRKIDFVPVSEADYLAQARSQGVDDEFLALYEELFALLDGRNASTTNDLKRALGREPGDFATFVARNAHAWRQ